MNPAQDCIQQGEKVSKTRNSNTGSLPIKLLLKTLAQSKLSRLDIRDNSANTYVIGEVRQGIPIPKVILANPWAILRSSASGLMGFAEAYIAGYWDTTSLVDVTDWAMANEKSLEDSFSGTWHSRLLHRLIHLTNGNSKRGSRKNISAHYDLGNDFYQLWLDDSMTYSSGLFLNASESLELAQANKYAQVLEWLDLQPNHGVLEIGCGWGGFAEVLQNTLPVSYHGVTLSKEQLAYTQQRLPGSKNYKASLTDYRDIQGQYDRIISIEMMEAVGETHWPRYFNKIKESLRQQGQAVLQVITIDDQRFNSYRKSADFIQRYIFPGGMLPSHRIMQEQIAQSGLELHDSFAFGLDYAKTIQAWRHQFLENWPKIQALGFDERFKRTWCYYLAYCESGFKSASINVRLYKIKQP